MQDFDATLGIYSSKNAFIEGLTAKFQDKYIEVITFDNFKKVILKDLNYLIINLLDGGLSDITNIKNEILDLDCKIVVLAPLYIKNEEKFVFDSNINDLLNSNRNLGVILVPELLGSTVKYNPLYVSHSLIMQSILSERVKINSMSGLINSISVTKLVDVIVKEMFSFGISGQTLALVGPRRSPKSFVTNYLSISDENIILVSEGLKITEASRSVSSKIDFSLNLAVKATKKSFGEDIDVVKSSILEVPTEEIQQSKPRIVKRKSKIGKYVARLFGLLLLPLFIFITPFVILFLSVLFLYLASSTAFHDVPRTEKLISYSLKTVALSQNISFSLPFYYNYSNLVYKTSFLFSEVLELSKIGNEFANKIMGKETYDLSYYSDNISAILDRIHTDTGFLQSDVDELNDFGGRKIKEFLYNSKIDIGAYKNKIYYLRNFSSRFSTLLGMDKPMKYLILFQNNMELRPTGGFIGSFATVSFDKGRLTEIVVSDVYSADGQLKGHVDPPEPIRIHLGEGGWYLRDANWDPSFPDSVSKIEWFLEKEINTQVDGVISIDLSFVKSLLKITGPINLVDFGKVIDSENLYVSTQEQVESNFFPGSIQKTSFLTALSKQLITEIQSLPKEKYLNFFKALYLSLEEKHIQLYFHDYNAEESIDSLGYSGNVDMNTDCGLMCFYDKYSLIDANLGVNKANLYIKRTHELNLDVTKSGIKHELLVTYENSANTAVENAGVYKSYTRLLVPVEANITGVRQYSVDGSHEDLPFDVTDINGRREVGFLIKILPSNIKKIQMVWNINTDKLKNGGEYKLNVRKQAGTDNDILRTRYNKTDLSLTGRVPSVYTTTLSRDFYSKLFFK